MRRTIVITGSGSGMGEATATRLRAKGHRVIGVDLQGADVNVDLALGRELVFGDLFDAAADCS